MVLAAKPPGDLMPPRQLTAREITADLAARIAAGEHEPGSRLPTYEALIELYGVSRATIQRAMARLEAQGAAEHRPGVGWYVAEQP